MANNQNLRPPWKKGESGNPAGLPKGYIRTSTIFNELLKGKMPVIEDGKRKMKKRMDVMAIKAVADAISDQNTANERTKARESIYNRIEGKPVQPIGTVPEPEIILNISPDEARL